MKSLKFVPLKTSLKSESRAASRLSGLVFKLEFECKAWLFNSYSNPDLKLGFRLIVRIQIRSSISLFLIEILD